MVQGMQELNKPVQNLQFAQRLSVDSYNDNYDLCSQHLSAKLLVLATSLPSKSSYSLHAFGKIVEELASVSPDSEVTAEDLLNTPIFKKLFFNENNVITGFCM